MKYWVCCLFIFTVSISFSQSKNIGNTEVTNQDSVTFIATIDLNKATKDGIYLNGYVVNIPYSELRRLDKKQVQLSGVVTVRKGLNSEPNTYENGVQIHSQGREEDMKEIENPIW